MSPISYYEGCSCCSGDGILTNCCPDHRIPTMLFLTISGAGVAPCLAGTWPMPWDGFQWLSPDLSGACNGPLPGSNYFYLRCDETFGWILSSPTGVPCWQYNTLSFISVQCNPFQLIYSVELADGQDGDLCGSGQALLVVTE